MNSAEKVRKACKDREIPFAKVEKALGFSNAYIAQKKGEWPTERLVAVANYLKIPLQDLMSDREDSSVRKVSYEIQTTEEQIAQIVRSVMQDQPHYYTDPEAAAIANELKENPEMKILFDACRKVKKEDIEKVARLVRAFTEEE